MATPQAARRLAREYRSMEESPPPYIIARPEEENILEWHYVIQGPPGTPYAHGQYHGTLTFPSDYPYRPPAIRMITPSGRFKEGARLCLSMSDYHPDLWNPGWSVSTILNGLLSFMTGEEATTGSVVATTQQRRLLASRSARYNAMNNVRFASVFPDLVEKNLEELRERERNPDQVRELFQLDGGRPATHDDHLSRAAQERAVSLDEIADPADRIRAEQALEDARRALHNASSPPHLGRRAPTSSVVYVAIALVVFALGVFVK